MILEQSKLYSCIEKADQEHSLHEKVNQEHSQHEKVKDGVNSITGLHDLMLI